MTDELNTMPSEPMTTESNPETVSEPTMEPATPEAPAEEVQEATPAE